MSRTPYISKTKFLQGLQCPKLIWSAYNAKHLLPALTGKDYTNLEIQEGETASREFLRVTFANVSESERKRVRRALEKYCGQDTEGMVWILDELRGIWPASC